MTQQQLIYGNERIHYRVLRAPRRHKTIAIHVHPDGSVQVTAPAVARDHEIREAVTRRARWIWRHLQRIREEGLEILPRRYVSGESHLYLGRRYLLKVETGTRQTPGVRLYRGQLQVKTGRKHADAVRGLLMQWYRKHAEQVFARRLDALLPSLVWKQRDVPVVRLREMKKRWGSCSVKGVITLNPHLVKAPRECVDYVIYHELCHLREHNHSPRFYHLLDRVSPEWRITKVKLDGMAGVLLNI